MFPVPPIVKEHDHIMLVSRVVTGWSLYCKDKIHMTPEAKEKK